MTPEEARELLKFSENYEKRRKRYELEGGKRRQWHCESGCGYSTEAESIEEARANLRRHRFHDERLFHSKCKHEKMRTGPFMPPDDFS